MSCEEAIIAGLYVLAFLLAVVDGTLQDKGTYPSGPGRVGFKAYARAHLWLLVGGVCGIAATLIGVL